MAMAGRWGVRCGISDIRRNTNIRSSLLGG
jgi:ribosomal protein L37AE/L43A